MAAKKEKPAKYGVLKQFEHGGKLYMPKGKRPNRDLIGTLPQVDNSGYIQLTQTEAAAFKGKLELCARYRVLREIELDGMIYLPFWREKPEAHTERTVFAGVDSSGYRDFQKRTLEVDTKGVLLLTKAEAEEMMEAKAVEPWNKHDTIIPDPKAESQARLAALAAQNPGQQRFSGSASR